MASFETMFPTFLQVCSQLHDLLQTVAFMFFIVGTVMVVMQEFNERSMALQLLHILVLTSLLAFLPQWCNAIQSVVQSSIIGGLGVDPASVQDQYNQLLDVKQSTTTNSDTTSWWDILGKLNSFTVEHLISGILWPVGVFAFLLLFWAYTIQKLRLK